MEHTETRGRKLGSKNAPKEKNEKIVRGARVVRVAQLTVNGMSEGSRVMFNITQAKADLLFGGKIKIESVYKIGSMIAAKKSHSGRDECALQTLGGSTIGFVLLDYLKPENVQ